MSTDDRPTDREPDAGRMPSEHKGPEPGMSWPAGSGDRSQFPPATPSSASGQEERTVIPEDPGQPYPDQPSPDQPSPDASYPGQSYPGQSYSGQSYPGQSYPGQSYPGQSYPGQSYPGQSYPGQSYPGQSYPGQSYPGQSYPGQPYPGQPYPGQPYSGQPYPGQPYPGQPYSDASYPGQSYPGQPGAAGQAPAGRTRSRRPSVPVVLLAVATVVALVVAGVAVVRTGGAVGDRRHTVAALKDQREAQLKRQSEEKSRLQSEMADANLPGLLSDVTAKNVAYLRTVGQWAARGKKVGELNLIQMAQSRCMAAIVEYDYNAAKYADILPSNLPARVDLTDENLNCGVTEFRKGATVV